MDDQHSTDAVPTTIPLWDQYAMRIIAGYAASIPNEPDDKIVGYTLSLTDAIMKARPK